MYKFLLIIGVINATPIISYSKSDTIVINNNYYISGGNVNINNYYDDANIKQVYHNNAKCLNKKIKDEVDFEAPFDFIWVVIFGVCYTLIVVILED